MTKIIHLFGTAEAVPFQDIAKADFSAALSSATASTAAWNWRVQQGLRV
jgi:hypothetical protein